MYDRFKLRAVMETQGRRVDWLADQLEVGETHVSKVLNGHAPLAEKFALKAARVLGVPVEMLRADEHAEVKVSA
jgi:plasmid maintenance system antidote protein VapI